MDIDSFPRFGREHMAWNFEKTNSEEADHLLIVSVKKSTLLVIDGRLLLSTTVFMLVTSYAIIV